MTKQEILKQDADRLKQCLDHLLSLIDKPESTDSLAQSSRELHFATEDTCRSAKALVAMYRRDN